jgi:L-proline amide hydrolase
LPDLVEGTVRFGDHETWYLLASAREGAPSGRPLVALHGGPGCTHDYLLSLLDLVRDDRPVLFYDQLGNGRSTHLPDAPGDFWNVELFLAELDNLLESLGLAADYDLLGQSWGGMLGAEHAVRQPPGLRRLVISNSPASIPLWLAAAAQLRDDLPAETLRALEHHEAAGTVRSAEYRSATEVFYDRHVCRLRPRPPEVQRTFDWMDRDPTVYEVMNGPTEFHVIGSLREWSVIDRLPAVRAKTLVINGQYDEATDDTVRPFVEHIPDARWHRFEHSSHLPHWEERPAYMRVVAEFLDA